MCQFPKEPKKTRDRIRRYERELRKEYQRFGAYDDSAGKRYLLGPLYLILGDLPGALKSFEWFKQNFPDDMGEAMHYLCWTLALYRSGDLAGATQKLRQTMLSNLYVMPYLLGETQAELDIWHGTNLAEPTYLQWIPPEILELWDEEALNWAKAAYHSLEISQIRTRYIEIYHQLKSEPRGPRRSQLVKEASELQGGAKYEAAMETNQAWAADIRRTRHSGDFSRWQDHDAYQQAYERLLWDLWGVWLVNDQSLFVPTWSLP